MLEIDHKTDAVALMQAAGDRACLLGNIDTNLLARGTPDEIDAACRELIERCGAGGGLILGPGCALPPQTPADNIHALVESAKRYSAQPVG